MQFNGVKHFSLNAELPVVAQLGSWRTAYVDYQSARSAGLAISGQSKICYIGQHACVKYLIIL